MDVNKFRDFILFLAKKAQSGANPTPDQFNIALERGFIEWIMERYGNPNEYQIGMPVPRIAWQQTQKISDDLRFLLTKHSFLVPPTGRLLIPDGTTIDLDGVTAGKYLHHSSLSFTYNRQKNGKLISSNEVPIDVLRDDELGARVSSSIVNPTRRYPVCAYFNEYIQFYPKDLSRINFSYLRTPVVPFWAFTIENGRPVYDPSSSVQIESPDETHNEIAVRVLTYLGISIREQELVAWAEAKKQQGI